MKRSITRAAGFALVAALGFASSLPASAGIISLEADIDGAQASAGAGTGSPGTGSATMTLDDVSLLFSWDVRWSDLLGTVTVAHFHGPAAPDENAGVEVDFLTLAPGNPSIGSTTISEAQAADLLNGLWYVNIHSDEFPAGEIRGQVTRTGTVPAPGIAALIGIGLAGFAGARRKQTS